MGEKDAVVYAGFLHDVVEDTNVLRCNTDA
jgi:(p)ppGpp synthase/HD superfamily hydrolase